MTASRTPPGSVDGQQRGAPAVDWPALLLDYRKAKGLKQEAAAADFGVSQSTISRWESGASTPTVGAKSRLFRAARRARSPMSTLAWVDTFRRLPIAGAITSQARVDVITRPLFEALGVPAEAVEGLAVGDAFCGELLDVIPALIEAGFFAGRVASYEATLRLDLSPRIRRNRCVYVHYIGWPQFIGDGRIARVSQGVITSPAESLEVRSRLKGPLKLSLMD